MNPSRLSADHELVTWGPYGLVRHPIYTSTLCLLQATGLILAPWSLLAIVTAAFILGTQIRLRAEDRLLASRVGVHPLRAALTTPAPSRDTLKPEASFLPTSFPYETRLNILHAPLESIDEKALADACEYNWYNQTLCKVNDSLVRLGVVEGVYHWHKHDEDDEFFYVVEGRLLIDLEDRTVELVPRQGMVVPKGVVHRTRALERTVILMVENAGIVPTGD